MVWKVWKHLKDGMCDLVRGWTSLTYLTVKLAFCLGDNGSIPTFTKIFRLLFLCTARKRLTWHQHRMLNGTCIPSAQGGSHQLRAVVPSLVAVIRWHNTTPSRLRLCDKLQLGKMPLNCMSSWTGFGWGLEKRGQILPVVVLCSLDGVLSALITNLWTGFSSPQHFVAGWEEDSVGSLEELHH